MKYAIKRLRHSDLTFFEAYFRRATGSKQKAINLDARIFADEFFPRLSRANAERPKRLLLDLVITGPNGAPALTLARKAILEKKNWRLNGELVNNPLEAPQRFDVLAPDDIAVLAFDGDDTPSFIALAIFASASPDDASAFAALAARIGDESMVATDVDTLRAAFAGLAEGHAAHSIVPDAAFEEAVADAAQGGVVGVLKLGEIARTHKAAPRITPAALERLRRRAFEIGEAGEELIADVMDRDLEAGKFVSHAWVSRTNAAAPYDFTHTNAAGAVTRIDAKTTTGAFTRLFHISGAELLEAASGSGPYLIYRVYELTETGARLRRSNDITAFARSVLERLKGLQAGIHIDNFSIDPALLTWADEEVLEA